MGGPATVWLMALTFLAGPWLLAALAWRAGRPALLALASVVGGASAWSMVGLYVGAWLSGGSADLPGVVLLYALAGALVGALLGAALGGLVLLRPGLVRPALGLHLATWTALLLALAGWWAARV